MQKIEEGKNYSVYLNNDYKLFKSEEANYIFNMKNGFTMTWNPKTNEDPLYFPVPEILDMEVTTICQGPNGIPCPFCYKSNNPNGKNMSFETFKQIFDVLPKSITQIAFGIDANATSNPDLWKMMEYCRENNIVPNTTVANISDETADLLSKYCGAVSVSRYADKNLCYDSIKRLTDRGMAQVNMHYMIAEETYEGALETLNDIKTDPRLSKMNAIVFLSLKKKGRAAINPYNCLSQDKFDNLVKTARELGVNLGFDTCSGKKSLKSLEADKNAKDSISLCESSRESAYISTDGEYFPCSFTEGTEGWETGINVLECNSTQDFIDKVWNNPRTVEFRNNLIKNVCNGCRSCPIYDI